MRGRVQEVVIYFKFHENQLRGLGAVVGWKSPSPIDKAHGLYNSLYYTVQAVMVVYREPVTGPPITGNRPAAVSYQ